MFVEKVPRQPHEEPPPRHYWRIVREDGDPETDRRYWFTYMSREQADAAVTEIEAAAAAAPAAVPVDPAAMLKSLRA